MSILLRLKSFFSKTKVWYQERTKIESCEEQHVGCEDGPFFEMGTPPLHDEVPACCSYHFNILMCSLKNMRLQKQEYQKSVANLCSLLGWNVLVMVQNSFNIAASAMLLNHRYVGAFSFEVTTLHTTLHTICLPTSQLHCTFHLPFMNDLPERIHWIHVLVVWQDRFVLAASVTLTWAAVCEYTNYIPRVNLFKNVFQRGSCPV